MYRNLLLGGALSLALLSWPASTASKQSTVNFPAVRQIVCAGGKGTGFRIADGRWVSVAHVTNNLACSIHGMPLGAKDEPGDFSITDYEGKAGGFPVNCEGFKPGEYYFAIGYAGGFEWQTMTRHMATYKLSDDGYRILLGSPTVIPGMSGGPILNAKGEVVGTVNMYSKIYPLSFSRELKDTSLCK